MERNPHPAPWGAQRPRGFIAVSEYGASFGEIAELDEWLRSLMGRMDAESEGWTELNRPKDDGPLALALATFGPSDLVVVHFVRDMRYLAIVETIASVRHQRAVGAEYGAWTAEGQWIDRLDYRQLLTPHHEHPWHAVLNVKIDVLTKLLTRGAVQKGLQKFLIPALQRCADRVGDEGRRRFMDVQLMVAPGLDTAECVIVARSARIDHLARLAWCLRSLTVEDVRAAVEDHARKHDAPPIVQLELGQHAKMLCERLGVKASEAPGLLGSLPVVAYVSSTVGLPLEWTVDSKPPEGLGDAETIRRGAMVTRVTSSEIGAVHRAITDAHGQVSAEVTTPLELFGAHGTLVGTGLEREHAKTLTTLTVRDLLRTFVGLVEAERGPPAGAAAAPRREVPAWNNTLLAVEVFDDGVQRKLPSSGLHRAFRELLWNVRAQWVGGWKDSSREPRRPEVGGAYAALRDEARRFGWAYTRTNTALNMLLSMVNLTSHSVDMEGYLDLLPVLVCWLSLVADARTATRRANLDRILNHLDRALRLRQGRERPDRSPRLTRSSEARCGYVVPRDAFYTYLKELMVLRMPGLDREEAPAFEPILVDAAGPNLGVKESWGAGLYYVSAQRLVEPVLWPSVVHEVDHVRLMHTVAGDEVFERVKSRLRLLPYEPEAWVARVLAKHPDASLASLARGVGENMWRETRKALEAAGLPPDESDFEFDMLGVGEVLYDLALFDAELVGSTTEAFEERTRRYYLTLLPNLIMDIHDRDYATHSSGVDILVLVRRAREYLHRFVSVLAMAQIEPWPDEHQGAAPEPSEIEQRLHDVLEDHEVWKPMLRHLLQNTTRSFRDADSELTEKLDEIIDAAAERAQTTLDLQRWPWPEILAVLHAARQHNRESPGAFGEPPEHDEGRLQGAVAEVQTFLADLSEHVPDHALLPVNPRGGLHERRPAARFQRERIGAFYRGMTEATNDARLEALLLFLKGPPCGGGGSAEAGEAAGALGEAGDLSL